MVKIIKIMLLKKIFFSPIKFFFNFFFNPSIPIFQVFQTFLYINMQISLFAPSSFSLQLFLHFLLYLLFFFFKIGKEYNTFLVFFFNFYVFSSTFFIFIRIFSTLMRINQLDLLYHYSNPFYLFLYFILF